MITSMISVAAQNDSELVGETLSGNRDAFGQIVSRYQSLICSLAYSATGSLGQSEDLAQETFIVAWKRLSHLRERDKLRAWLCGIARNRINNFLRREGREPNHRAEPIEEIAESHSPEPLPIEHTITKEEEQILWRSLERIPEIYREPLVLFYREHQSIETVAANLDLTEDAVKQRLSRGRKLLQEQVLAFVEGTLSRTNPGKTFTLAVLASLPLLTISAKAATIGSAAAKGGASVKAAGVAGLLGVIFSPLLILFGNYLPYRIGLAEARSDEERGHVKLFFRKVWAMTFGMFVLFAGVFLWLGRNHFHGGDLFGVLFVGLVLIYLFNIFVFVAATRHHHRAYYSKILAQEHGGVFPKPAWEYRSETKFLGLPLIHIRIGDRFDMLQKPVKAWIAFGNHAIGGLIAFGGLAIAPISIGGLTVGVFSLGGFVFGVFPLGALALGIWAFGGLAVGWQAFGGGAIAWNAAAGNFALAHDFAIGNVAHASQAGNAIAHQFIESKWFFRCIEFISRHWFWVNFLWITPLLIQWWLVSRKSATDKK
ncbi:MAG TPA: sigma-70 family RNA polymerase sigma factor [Verrucomicrobiae bacterium]|nr:sigma-70 family RNA polymerase sigma factor [Verrucomicrobiae bacterium]